MLPLMSILLQHPRNVRQIHVGEAGTHFTHSLEKVRFVIVDSTEQSTVAPSSPSPTVKGTDHDQVDGIHHLALIAGLELHPEPGSRPGPIYGVVGHRLDHQSLRPIRYSLLEELIQLSDIECNQSPDGLEPLRLVDDVFEALSSDGVGLQCQVLAVGVEALEQEDRYGELLHHLLYPVLPPALH